MSPNAQNPVSADRLPEQDAAAAEKVRRVFSCLSKLILGRKIYARNNPTLVRFAGEFSAAIGEFFEEEDVLVVSVDKNEIRWNDVAVYQNDKRDESIAFILYKDGVGELSIKKSVTQDEISRFVDLAKDAVRASSQDDDIVTQLWRADFEHISYRVLDEYLVGQFGEGRPDRQSSLASLEQEDHPDTPGSAEGGRVIINGKNDIEPLDTYLARLAGGGVEMAEEQREENFQSMMTSFFTVSSDELRAFKEKLFDTKRKDPVVGFISEYLDFALITEDGDVPGDALGVVEKLSDYLILELRGPVLAALLEEVRSFRAKHKDRPQLAAFLDGLEKRLTDPALLVSIGETVRSSEEEAEEAFAYFERVGEAAVPVVCKLIEEDSDPRLHKRARSTLVRAAGAKLPEVIGRLNIDKPQIARDVIALTKAARLPEIPQVIRELVYYPDDHVRYEAIQFLASFGSDEALAVLVKLLDDADKGIRLKTLSVVSGVEASVVRDKLVAIAFGKEFTEREFDEQMEIFKALGRIVGEDALPRLKESVGRKNFLGFAKRHNKENKLLAIEALEQMDEPGAKRLLADLAEDSDEGVRARASEALRRAAAARAPAADGGRAAE